MALRLRWSVMRVEFDADRNHARCWPNQKYYENRPKVSETDWLDCIKPKEYEKSCHAIFAVALERCPLRLFTWLRHVDIRSFLTSFTILHGYVLAIMHARCTSIRFVFMTLWSIFVWIKSVVVSSSCISDATEWCVRWTSPLVLFLSLLARRLHCASLAPKLRPCMTAIEAGMQLANRRKNWFCFTADQWRCCDRVHIGPATLNLVSPHLIVMHASTAQQSVCKLSEFWMNDIIRCKFDMNFVPWHCRKRPIEIGMTYTHETIDMDSCSPVWLTTLVMILAWSMHNWWSSCVCGHQFVYWNIAVLHKWHALSLNYSHHRVNGLFTIVISFYNFYQLITVTTVVVVILTASMCRCNSFCMYHYWHVHTCRLRWEADVYMRYRWLHHQWHAMRQLRRYRSLSIHTPALSRLCMAKHDASNCSVDSFVHTCMHLHGN